MTTPKRFTVIFFLSITLFMMSLVSVSFAVKQISKAYEETEEFVFEFIFEEEEEEEEAPPTYWEKLYPFEEIQVADPQVRYEDKTTKKETLYTYIKRKCEEYTSKYLLGYESFVEAARIYEEAINWNIADVRGYNSVVTLHDGYLTTFTESRDITATAEAVIKFASWCNERGIEFFYANYPHKICIYEDSNISGKLDFTNQNADRFLAKLEEAGVRTYDFRKLLHEDAMKHHESFYRTDHHWKAETGLWASQHILRILRDDFGWPVNPEVLNPENFDYVIYPEWFLGSQGKKLTLSRTTPDDFTMIYPKFSSNLHIEIPDISLDTIGDFTVTYDMEQVEEKDYYDKDPYGAYDHADHPIIRINNYLELNRKKVLVIHTSFGDSVVPFMSLAIQYVDEIDLRHFTGSTIRYIKDTKPDIVMVTYTSEAPGQQIDKSKHNNIYDFR